MKPSFPTHQQIHDSDEAQRGHSVVPLVAIPLPNNSTTFEQSDAFHQDGAMNHSSIPFAPALVSYNDYGPEVQSRAIEQKTRLAEDIGRVKSLTETEQIKVANYHSKMNPKIERMRIINAGDVAKQRSVEGLEVKYDNYFNEQELLRREKEKMIKEQQRNQSKEKRGDGGYNVKDYDVSEYSGYEYDTSYEYKSIYE